MSDPTPKTEFTPEEICEQATGNAAAAGLALLVYARERGESPEAVAAWLGRAFAPGWEGVRGQGARGAMRWVALNLVSLGCDLRSIAGDEGRAEATVTGWPGEESLAFFRVSQKEADALFGVFGPVAEHLGLGYSWRREGETVALVVEQTGG